MIRWLARCAAIEIEGAACRFGYWLRPYDHTAPSERRWRWQRRGCLRPEHARQRAAVQQAIEQLDPDELLRLLARSNHPDEPS